MLPLLVLFLLLLDVLDRAFTCYPLVVWIRTGSIPPLLFQCTPNDDHPYGPRQMLVIVVVVVVVVITTTTIPKQFEQESLESHRMRCKGWIQPLDTAPMRSSRSLLFGWRCRRTDFRGPRYKKRSPVVVVVVVVTDCANVRIYTRQIG